MEEISDDVIRRKRLVFRASRRGFREADLVLGGFAEAHISSLSEEELDAFEALLNAPDWDVYAWAIRQKEAPANYQTTLLDKVIAYASDELSQNPRGG